MVYDRQVECDQLLPELVACRCDGELAAPLLSSSSKVFEKRANLLMRLSAAFLLQTLGNHEFDDNIEGVAPFLNAINSPLVLANVDTTDEPALQGKFPNSTILERAGRRIGVIGVLTRDTQVGHVIRGRLNNSWRNKCFNHSGFYILSQKFPETGKLRFRDEVQTAREESQKLKDQGIDIILLLSHCGLDADYQIAREAGEFIDVIVGGHSHSFLYSGANPPGVDVPEDEYPAVIVQANGHKVLIVQAAANARYVGDLEVFFDEHGKLVHWKGQPIYLDANVPEGRVPTILAACISPVHTQTIMLTI